MEDTTSVKQKSRGRKSRGSFRTASIFSAVKKPLRAMSIVLASLSAGNAFDGESKSVASHFLCRRESGPSLRSHDQIKTMQRLTRWFTIRGCRECHWLRGFSASMYAVGCDGQLILGGCREPLDVQVMGVRRKEHRFPRVHTSLTITKDEF